jgi:hypothetical protein
MIDRVWLCGRNQSIQEMRISEAETTVAMVKNISTIAKPMIECSELRTKNAISIKLNCWNKPTSVSKNEDDQ